MTDLLEQWRDPVFNQRVRPPKRERAAPSLSCGPDSSRIARTFRPRTPP